MKIPFFRSSLIVALMLSQGCAPRNELQGDITADVNELSARATVSNEEVEDSAVLVSQEAFISSEPQPAANLSSLGEVSINVNGVDFYDIIAQVADSYDISLIVAQGVSNRSISVNLKNLSPVAAIKEIARAAGYVAAYTPGRNIITLTPRALYSFKLPTAVFSALGEEDPLVPLSDLEVGAIKGSPETDIEERLKSIIGTRAIINVLPATGIITVEGDIHALDLAHDFLNRYLAVVTASINIRAAVIAVNLVNTDSLGVNWEAVLGGVNKPDAYSITQAADLNTGFVVDISTRNLSAILTLLKSDNSVEILSQPQIALNNLQSAALFSGEKVPYLSSIASSTTDNVVTLSGETSVANSGILLQVTGDILNKTHVQMRIQPTISAVREFRTFDLSGSQLTVPLEDISTTNSVVTIESGQTLILGGVRSSNQALRTKSINFDLGDLLNNITKNTEDSANQREFWILINVTIAEGALSESLIGEKAVQ